MTKGLRCPVFATQAGWHVTSLAQGGSILVAAQVEDSRIERVMAAYREYGAVDLDAREAEWREGSTE